MTDLKSLLHDICAAPVAAAQAAHDARQPEIESMEKKIIALERENEELRTGLRAIRDYANSQYAVEAARAALAKAGR